jgi:hypothetical protein
MVDYFFHRELIYFFEKEVLFSSIVSFGGEKLKLGCLKQEKGTEGINIPMTKIDLDDDFFDNNKMVDFL